jgi:amidase
MTRRAFLRGLAIGSAAWLGPLSGFAGLSRKKPVAPKSGASFELEELTIAELQEGLASRQFTAASLVRQYQRQIEQVDRSGPALRSVIELNPDALAIAAKLDRERKANRVRGPLHGIPVLVKDNIDTHDRMMCTAGSLALQGSHPTADAFIVRRLRQAGAVILGKANLSEWANFRGARSTSGWSGRGGQTRNPYVLDRNPSGSSSGSAVAVSASLCAVAVGTETNGSIVSPASCTGVVGMKPTVGLVSRSGIIPIAQNQDTAGPMARCVADAAVLLNCLAAPDPKDPGAGIAVAPGSAVAEAAVDYTKALDARGLRGARIGVARSLFRPRSPQVKQAQERALEALREAGATLIDPVELPEIKGDSYLVMLYEFKAGLNAYLCGLGPEAPIRSLKELIEFNERHREKELHWFGQEILIEAEEKGPLTEKAYLDTLAACRESSRRGGLDAVMERHQLDAVVAPTTGPAHVTDYVHGDRDIGGSSTPAAVAGYPSITVPAGWVQGLPVGLSFFGRAWSEPVLLRLAFSFEQTTWHRTPPRFKPSLR